MFVYLFDSRDIQPGTFLNEDVRILITYSIYPIVAGVVQMRLLWEANKFIL